MLESTDPDGVARLTIEGEFDITMADAVSVRLAQFASHRTPVRIDLSHVDFIDSSGLRAVLVAVRSGREHGNAPVVIDPKVSRQVRRLFDLVGLSGLLETPPVL